MAKKKTTPLVEAVKEGSKKKVKALLKKGADPKEMNPLFIACSNRSVPIARLLLEHGADPNRVTSDYPGTAFQRCINWWGKPASHLAIVELMLEFGADPNNFPKDQGGVLQHAADYKHPKIIAVLLAAGADVNLPGEYGAPVISCAAKAGIAESVELLLDAGADVNAKGGYGQNALYELVGYEEPSVAIAKLLIEAGIDVNATSEYKDTPLARAAEMGHDELVELLLENGAKIDQPGSSGQPPVIKALNGKHFDTVQLLLERGANPKTQGLLKIATQVGAADLVATLLQTVECKDPAALTEAARNGKLEFVEQMLKSGYAVDGRPHKGDKTALITAAYHGHLEIVKLLLASGADTEARDYKGDTALMNAAYCGHPAIVKLLVKKGASLAATNKHNWTALMQAVVTCHAKIVRFLLDKGSPLDEIDREWGYTALTIAKTQRVKKIIELLESYGAKERKLKRPSAKKGYFLITKCDICAYLPHDKRMEKTEYPMVIPTLEKVNTKSYAYDRYIGVTELFLQCPICGTYYEQEHSIDSEDSFICGPGIHQTLKRCSLERAAELLAELGNKKALAALKKRSPKLRQRFAKLLAEGAEIAPNIRPYVEKVAAS